MRIVHYARFTVLLLLSIVATDAHGYEWGWRGSAKEPLVGAFDPTVWNGIVLVGRGETVFALRFDVSHDGRVIRFDDFCKGIISLGTCAPKSAYCELKWRFQPPPQVDNFSIRWTGKVRTSRAGEYTFFVESDDGARLWIDGKLIMDEWKPRSPTETFGKIHLDAGEHDIRLEYFELGGGAMVILRWSGPQIRKQVIPASALSSDGKRGLRGEYFTNIELKGKPAMVRYDEAIAFRWEAGSPFEKLKMPAIEVTWRWANLGSGRIIGIVDVSRGALLRVSGYQPWKFEPSYLVVDKKELQGKVRGALDEDIKAVLAFIGNASPERCGDDYLIYRVAPDRPLAFAIAFKASRKELPERLEIEAPTVERVKKRLDALANKYTARKAREGVSYEAVGNALRWMTSYRPGSLKRYLPVGRRWVWGDITVLGFETFLSAIAVAPVDTDLAYDTLLALFSVQGENGIIPHRAIAPGKGTYDRSAPPIGSFCIWQIYRITKDKDLLRVTYPRLKRWHEWWLQRVETGKPRRDGNEDGLLEWGSDGGSLQSALAESSMHDSPLWDGVIFNWNTWTMECNAVDLNSLYALDALYLAKIATELGIYTHSNTFMREYERIRRLMNEAMWDERLGIYVDVRWDGRKSERIGASNFYPLLAGIPTKKRAERMRAVLRDDDKFWGKWMLPTISRDDRVFYQQRFWRGAIMPATNYLVYHALLEAGFVDEARALAKSSMELFLRDWNDGCRLRESWLATTGEGVGDDYYTLGALMALIGTGWQ